MKRPVLVRFALVLGVAAALSGCKKSESGSSAPAAINANCPMMPENAVSTKAPTVQYNGVTIGFCCEECVEKWNAWTDQQKADFVKANTPDVINKFGNPPPGETDH